MDYYYNKQKNEVYSTKRKPKKRKKFGYIYIGELNNHNSYILAHDEEDLIKISYEEYLTMSLTDSLIEIIDCDKIYRRHKNG